jgi:hypothetical protein
MWWRTLLAVAQLAVLLWLAFSTDSPSTPDRFAVATLALSAIVTAGPVRAAIYTRMCAVPPLDIRLIMDDDGEEIPCGVLREPALDQPGHPAWLLIPHKDVGVRLQAGYQISGHIPFGAILAVTTPRPDAA